MSGQRGAGHRLRLFLHRGFLLGVEIDQNGDVWLSLGLLLLYWRRG